MSLATPIANSQNILQPPLRQLKDLKHPTGLPLIGNALQFTADTAHLVLENWSDKFGPAFAFRLGGIQAIGIADLNMVRQITQQRPTTFRRMSKVETSFQELGFNGVFSVEGETWRRQRRLIMPSFRPKHLASLHGTVARIAQGLLDRCEQFADTGEAVDIHKLMMQFSVDVTTEISFGYRLNTLGGENAEFQQHLMRVFPGLNRRLLSPIPYWRWFRLPRDRALDRSMRYLKALVQDIVHKTREQLKQGSEASAGPKNLLQTLLGTPESDGDPPLSEEEIFSNVITLLLAGEDTTANGLAWAVHQLALAPSTQDKAAQEAQAALEERSVVSSFEEAGRMKYLGATIEEVMRLRSPAPFLFLEANEDTVVGDLAVPAGTLLALLTRKIGMQSELFSDPHRFLPERWLGETASDEWRHTPRAQLAYGSGPRVCPGRSLATLESQVVLSCLLNRYEFEHAAPAEKVEERFSFTMHPKNLSVRLKRRTPAAR